ncbi:MAG: transglutaminase family protein [Spirochaetales bacterium]|nr:transglutaminase family protein [Spirochaetales bacterium]
MGTKNNTSYLESTRLLNYEHPALKALIDNKHWKELPEFERIGAVYEFVRNTIYFGYNSSDELKASQVLDDGYGQCNTKATLLMSLLRACNIPCRFHAFKIEKSVQKGIITGLAYKITPQNIIHSWVEVWFKESWIILEGVIIDDLFLQSLRQHFSNDKEFNAYGVSTPDLMNPLIEWKGKDTFIQNMGINHDFGIFSCPDDFYAQHGSNLSGFKKCLYSRLVRHSMNRKVQKIRKQEGL